MSSIADLLFTFLAKGTPGSPFSVTTNPFAPTAANVLDGRQTFTTTTAATTLVTVPQGRTWVGKVGASCSVAVTAAAATAGQSNAVFSIAGAGATPSGNIFGVDAKAGTNGATGTVGSQGSNFGATDLVVVAPAGNSVTIQVTTTMSGSQVFVDAFAIGQLI